MTSPKIDCVPSLFLTNQDTAQCQLRSKTPTGITLIIINSYKKCVECVVTFLSKGQKSTFKVTVVANQESPVYVSLSADIMGTQQLCVSGFFSPNYDSGVCLQFENCKLQ